MEATDKIKTAVEKGMELLDARVPNWWRKIDLDELDMKDCAQCVLGQTFGHDIEQALGAEMFGLPRYSHLAKKCSVDFPNSEDTGYIRGCRLLFGNTIPSYTYGFNTANNANHWQALKCEWTRVIAERRAVDATSTQETEGHGPNS